MHVKCQTCASDSPACQAYHDASLFFVRAVALQSTLAEQNARTPPPHRPSSVASAPNNSTQGIFFLVVTYIVFLLFSVIADLLIKKCRPVPVRLYSISLGVSLNCDGTVDVRAES
jgi:hypothetical protein